MSSMRSGVRAECRQVDYYSSPSVLLHSPVRLCKLEEEQDQASHYQRPTRLADSYRVQVYLLSLLHRNISSLSPSAQRVELPQPPQPSWRPGPRVSPAQRRLQGATRCQHGDLHLQPCGSQSLQSGQTACDVEDMREREER